VTPTRLKPRNLAHAWTLSNAARTGLVKMHAGFVVILLALLAGTRLASAASILISIDEARQEMKVVVDGVQRYAWPVSTGMKGYATPSGSFKPYRLTRDHISGEWNVPMPYSIFFTPGGHAIHATRYLKRLGRKASHGCIRLAPVNAEALYALVQTKGLRNTRIVINGAH